ncbi:WD40 repeat-containing protein, putative [Bodo saltans]|uniref:WD40 repeat-containing protein, putative n=1 Tax=Bodo saltans TaxID=75058 RepID=A0A0S4JDP4_BODSA|nr:WD40 repeat-containing protein, putative [Bodo saltans]|eukprot:CUG88094.1 WD40 repeat-containing protein, putative [Bodo saltans]
MVTAPLQKIPVHRDAIPESEFAANCVALGIKKPNRALAQFAATPSILEVSELDLSPNFIGGLGLQALTSIIYKNKNLTSLTVSRNGLSNESVVFFCRAFLSHPTLRVLDLSSNPISLPAGEALLDLATRNRVIEKIIVTDTQIEEAVQRKIARTINLRITTTQSKEASAKKIAANAPNSTATPYQRVVEEFAAKRQSKADSVEAKKSSKEAQALAQLRETCVSHNAIRPPEDFATGWTVLNVAVVGYSPVFGSELDIIINQLVPKLNARYAAQKIFFNVLETPARGSAGKGVDVDNLVVQVDHLADVKKSSGVVIELFGDRIGYVEQPPSIPASDKSTPKHPLQYSLHVAAASKSDAILVVCSRKPARQLEAPASMAPLFSDEPSYVHPDAQASAVKAAVANARGVEHKLAGFDFAVQQRAWNQHAAFRQSALDDTPDSQKIVRYQGTFDSADMQGRVFLKNLDEFASNLEARWSIIADRIASSSPAVANIAAAKTAALLADATLHSGVRKQLLGKMDLYSVTPPSRNMLLLHGAAGSTMSSTVAAYVQRSEKKPNYVVVKHFVSQSTIVEEPSDLRSMFLNLLGQLEADKALLSHIANEVDITRVKTAFQEALQKKASKLEDGKVLILAIDGLSELDEAVVPCANLRSSITGGDQWAPSIRLAPEPATTNKDGDATNATAASEDESAALGTAQQQPAVTENEMWSFIPVCLPRNVRIVGSAISPSPAFTALESRGRDSTDPVILTEFTPNEIDLIVQAELQRIGVQVSDEDMVLIGSKMGATSLDYLKFVVDSIQNLTEEPQYLSLSATLETLPVTVELFCDQLLFRLERAFGAPLVKRALGYLHFSRWGTSEMNLRDMLSSHDKKGGRLASTELNKLLRMLRPVLSEESVVSGAQNALTFIVQLRNRTFRRVLVARYFSSYERDVVPVHQQLTHHYLRFIQSSTDHPLKRVAFKELPYHAVKAGMWSLVSETVFSLDFISKCYSLGIGYSIFRECIRAFNTLDAASNAKKYEALLDKMKQYVYFVRDHNVNLVQFPHLVAQIAIGLAPTSHVYKDANRYFQLHPELPHLVIANRTTAKLHRENVTDAQYAPNGYRFATCSDDRSIRFVNTFGESVLQICQSASKLKLIRYSSTSRYLLGISEDRSNFVFDATSGQLVSKASGHTAVIRAAEFSIRGKFYATGSNDRTLKVWETETGALLATASHSNFTVPSCATGGVSQVIPHPLAEDTFFTVCDKKILGWKLAHLRDSLEEILCIQGHNTLPLTSLAAACDGAYLIACAGEEPRSQAADGVRAEENINIWTTSNGRHVATLGRGSAGAQGPVFAALAPSEKRLAAALADGSIQVYQLDFRSYLTEVTGDSVATAKPVLVQPYLHMTGFAGHATPATSLLRFSHDSALVFAIGNVRQLKVWTVVGNDPATEAEPKKISTYAEYLSDQRITALTTSPNPQEEGGSVGLGDATGRVISLRLITAKASEESTRLMRGE